MSYRSLDTVALRALFGVGLVTLMMQSCSPADTAPDSTGAAGQDDGKGGSGAHAGEAQDPANGGEEAANHGGSGGAQDQTGVGGDVASAGTGGGSDPNPVGEPPASQIPGVPLDEPGGVLVIKRFATSGGTAYFWADLTLTVMRWDDPSETWTVTTAGKDPGLVPAVRVRPDVVYDVRAYGGSIQRWSGTKFVPSTYEVEEQGGRVKVEANEILGFARYLGSIDLVMEDTWSPVVYGGDRWYCRNNQIGCLCSYDQPTTDSWTECAPIDYLCCERAEQGGDCVCDNSGAYACYDPAKADLRVDSCPIGMVPAGVAPPNPAECTTLEDQSTPVTSTVVAAALPAALGGEIQEGVYVATARVDYAEPPCEANPSATSGTLSFTPTSATQGTFALAGTTSELSGTYTTSGTTLSLTYTCPLLDPVPTFEFQYTADGSTLELQSIEEDDCSSEVTTFTAP